MSKWIDAEKELPKQAGHYLVVDDWMGIIEKAEFNGKDKWNSPFNVTHWQELPNAPSEEEEDHE